MDESDIYVRDHLLIQFMMEEYMYIPVCKNPIVEQIYDKWVRWLEEQEARHDKRSTV